MPPPLGFAIELRINLETLQADGALLPASGTLTAFDVPDGGGVRVETAGYTGYTANPRFDPLIAELIVHSRSPRFGGAVARGYRARAELRVEGIATNIPFLQNLRQHPAVIANQVSTRFVEDHLAELARRDGPAHPALHRLDYGAWPRSCFRRARAAGQERSRHRAGLVT